MAAEYKGNSLEDLSTHLTNFSFVDGHYVSQRDFELFETINSKDAQKYVAISRWWRHLSSTLRAPVEEVKEEKAAPAQQQAKKEQKKEPEPKKESPKKEEPKKEEPKKEEPKKEVKKEEPKKEVKKEEPKKRGSQKGSPQSSP
jgi:septal ring factor EnvC (AmiA/AmiB activator)